jgi:hypothetical protein
VADRQTATGEGGAPLRLEQELEPRPGGQEPTPSRSHPAEDLSICPCCARDFVYPVDWSPAGDKRWSVALRCPECFWHGGGVYEQDLVDRFDEFLDESMQSVLDDLELLTRSNMQEQIERFVAALEANQILPEDF